MGYQYCGFSSVSPIQCELMVLIVDISMVLLSSAFPYNLVNAMVHSTPEYCVPGSKSALDDPLIFRIDDVHLGLLHQKIWFHRNDANNSIHFRTNFTTALSLLRHYTCVNACNHLWWSQFSACACSCVNLSLDRFSWCELSGLNHPWNTNSHNFMHDGVYDIADNWQSRRSITCRDVLSRYKSYLKIVRLNA